MMCHEDKIRIVTRKEARRKARKLTKIFKIKTTSYKCEQCGGYHLTTASMEDRVAIRINNHK